MALPVGRSAERRSGEALVALALTGLVALGAVLVLLGWAMGMTRLESVMPGLTTMKANTAVGLLVASVALAVRQRPSRPGGPAWTITCAGGLLTIALAGATLVEYVFEARLGIDELLFADPATTSAPFPGRMSPATAVSLVALGSAAMLLTATPRWAALAAHGLALLPAAVGVLSLTGYAYSVESLYNFGPYVSVALNTSASLCGLAAAVFLTRADDGWRRSIVGRPAARAVLIRLLPWSLLVPFATGLLVLRGVRAGFYDALYGPAVFAVLTTGAFVGFAFVVTRAVGRAETALADSEEQFRAFAQAMPNHVWAADAAGRLTWVNGQVLAYCGATAGELTGEGWLGVVHPDDAPAATAAWVDALRCGARYETAFRIRRADGAYRWFLVRGEPIRDAEGVVKQWVGSNTDTHESRTLLADLETLNDTLEGRVAERTLERDRIWQVSLDMLGVADRRGVWLSVNPAWTRILGWPAEAFVGQTSAWLLHPDDLERARAVRDTLADGRTATFEGRYRTRDGLYRLLDWTGVPFEGRTYSVARDVTDERQRETAFSDLEDFTRLALSAAGGVGVWTYDAASDRFFCDAAIAGLYGLDVEQAAAGILRTEFTANVHPDDLAQLRATMAGGLLRSGDLELEYRIRHPDGSIRWVLSRGHTYHDSAGRPVRRTGVGIDTTRLRQLEEQLRHSQKMEAVGQLTGGVAHDFNNLLTVIRSSTDLLKRPDLPEERRARYVAAISDTVDRAARLTGQLLAFARRQALKPEVFDLGANVAAIGDMLETFTGSRISIATSLPEAACFVDADVSQFETAVINMVVNARDAMQGHGRLTIAVRPATGIPTVRGHAAVAGDMVALAIADTGAGIAPEQLERIFEPFYTTKGVGQGTGLGLSQVFGFAKQSGGEIAVESTLGQGTTFTLYLPRVTGVPRVDDAEEPAGTVGGQGTRVLIVEDNDDVGAFAMQTLGELGYRAQRAGDAAAALDALAQDAGGFDVVLSDVVMPGMSGIDLGQEIRRRHPGLPVVLTSGYSHVLAESGTFGFDLLHKPYSGEQLSRMLRKATAGRQGSGSPAE